MPRRPGALPQVPGALGPVKRPVPKSDEVWTRISGTSGRGGGLGSESQGAERRCRRRETGARRGATPQSFCLAAGALLNPEHP